MHHQFEKPIVLGFVPEPVRVESAVLLPDSQEVSCGYKLGSFDIFKTRACLA